ncbi:cysteine synthase B [candidate division CPR3 bacterium GWF2_35_18]|uniref:Cysteine synthase n=1 Tax=candidate division CPR3 bacterium GW2011_GWF2_35_18 TaxID=1618350 RepID=A0A0G0ERM9_UNCC3|nr:MAG: Cysteine synthase [candidate division CPR3 bacterium GW2011_GWF2_35_18]KKP86604.1 MAG: Cysteine synthase [candidate division CPR3 bacterium GW2011_GWE2_35_7]OGB62825.1 MAG: cysteine synthase B [candidate division CPR3 bacterium GWF2_35_18]OGB65406.1 MAG: cysteine synthase B [candidate division CPR3 bacterium RIFOXYA2_FULL_35_13]OGB76851.1 MAG: cysteine synthase B [candidate division CPR3 bacterium RIFOXYC2_FULL_35_7]OGB80435.1 MAG: cysteine synthase B [candidate division CPR3 bacterium
MKLLNILQTIGNTPNIELPRYSSNKNVKIIAKLEGNNPGGSIKDRIAKYMIEDAEKKKLIIPQTEIIEATSGNTGIGLAMISSIKGYHFTAVMSESASLERRKVLKAYGAKIILTDGEKGTNHAIEVTRKIIVNDKEYKYLMLDQFNNPANVLAHYETTGAEIIKDIPNITHFVAGMGTGGTLMGIGRRLKEYNPQIQVIGIEPKEKSKIQGLRNMSAYTPSIFRPHELDKKLNVLDEVAFELARDLMNKSGISVGISSGAALWGAIEISKNLNNGIIVTIFPDRGDRYLTTELFR